jgi:hypothetical protein
MREGNEVAAPALTRPNRLDLWNLLFLGWGRERLTTEHPVV